jgi:hypothetical protein
MKPDIGARLLPLAAAIALALPGTARSACSVTEGTDGNGNAKLTIKGDATAQTIFLLDAGVSVQVQVDCNNNGLFTDPGDQDQLLNTNVEAFEIAGGGKDVVSYQNTAALSGMRKSLAVTLGPSPAAQPNQLIVNPSGLSGNSSFTLDVQGGSGRDNVSVQVSNLTNSSVVVRGDLGAGDDQLFLVVLGSLTNSSVTTDVALGVGRNLLTDVPNAAFANSTYSTIVSGADTATGADAAALVADALVLDLGSRLVHDVRLLAGKDTFRGSIDGATLANGSELIVRARGGAGNDSLALDNVPSLGPVNVDDTSHLGSFLNGGIGNDQVTADLTFDNLGFHRFFLSGGDGDDIVFAGLGAISAAGAGPNEDIVLEGGRGSDAVYLAATDPNGGASFAPMGAVLMSGGSFDNLFDNCIFFGDAPFQQLDCESGS